MEKRVFIDIDELEIQEPFVVNLEDYKVVNYKGFSVRDVDCISVIKRFHSEDNFFYLAYHLYRGNRLLADLVTDIKEIVQIKDLGSTCFIC